MAYRDAQQVIDELGLAPHPEGGHYREVYRSAAPVGTPPGFPGPRTALTAIYFLLRRGEFSALHRVRSEEAWLHMAGAALELVQLDPDATVSRLAPAGEGGAPLRVVPPGGWQAARSAGDWSLVCCLVAPGFEFEDFELPDRAELLGRFPQYRDWILRFTR